MYQKAATGSFFGSPYSLDGTSFVGMITINFDESGVPVSFFRGNFASEFESCLGGATPLPGVGGIPSDFPRSSTDYYDGEEFDPTVLDYCALFDYDDYEFATCCDVVEDFEDWA